MIDIEIPLNISRLGSNYSAKAPLVNKTNKQKQNVLIIFLLHLSESSTICHKNLTLSKTVTPYFMV